MFFVDISGPQPVADSGVFTSRNQLRISRSPLRFFRNPLRFPRAHPY
jgi:hypothetical protein